MLTRSLALGSPLSCQGGWAGWLLTSFSPLSLLSDSGLLSHGQLTASPNGPAACSALSLASCVPVTIHLFLGQHQGRIWRAINLSPYHFLKSLSHSCHKHFWGTKHLAHPEPDNVSPLLSTPLFLNPLQAPLEASITSVQHQRITWVEGADLSSGIGLYHQSAQGSWPGYLLPLTFSSPL